MSYLELLSNRAWEHLVWVLLHTLWQGALIALLMSVVLRKMPVRASGTRYLVALAAQFAVILAGLVTWSLLDQVHGQTTPNPKYHALTPAFEPSAAFRSTSIMMPPFSGIRQPHGVSERPGWVPILEAIWLVGVGLMLTRTIASVLAASRLASGTRFTDPTILALLEQTRLELRIGRLIKVCAAGAEYGPAVIGAIWPTLVLPASMLTGLPSESLRLIIIHELAHVRRYDYLVNLAQMLIEAILFFNPAVWWIGRQVRLERDACCDAMVVRLTGRPLAYARSLAECAGRSRMPAIALSYRGGGRSSALLERIRRLVSPAESQGAVVSFSELFLLLVAGPLLLLALWSGTKSAVALAAQVLSPKERIEQVRTAHSEYAPLLSSAAGEATLKGILRTPSGQIPSRPIAFSYKSDDLHGHVRMGGLDQFQGDFSAEVPAGTVWLSLEPEDYSPMVVGPFDAASGKTVEGINIVLEAGFPAHIRVSDERGEPVAGAHIIGALDIGGDSVGSAQGWVSDRHGVATIPHAAGRGYNRQFSSPVKIDAAKPISRVEMRLSATVAAEGRVLNGDGKPLVSVASSGKLQTNPSQSAPMDPSRSRFARVCHHGAS